jgi:hypothetical protein
MQWYEIRNNIDVENFFVYHICTWGLFRSLNQRSQEYPIVTQAVIILNLKFYFCSKRVPQCMRYHMKNGIYLNCIWNFSF